MDIYLTPINGGGRFTFPSLPESIRYTRATNYHTYGILEIGEVKAQRGLKSDAITWSGTFYGKARKKLKFMRKWKNPKSCVSILKNWMEKEKICKLLVTGSCINVDVTISKFDFKEVGGHGDIEYTITFEQYRPCKIYTTSEMKVTNYEKKTVPRPDGNVTGSGMECTVKQGDTIYDLSRRYYGTGSDWTKIYEANKTTIDNAGKKYDRVGASNGFYLVPGIKLVIPEKSK